jgi:hypothetical protein
MANYLNLETQKARGTTLAFSVPDFRRSQLNVKTTQSKDFLRQLYHVTMHQVNIKNLVKVKRLI